MMDEYRPVSRRKWFALGCLTSLVLIVLAFVFMVVTVAKARTTTVATVKSNTYLDLDLSGAISEFSAIEGDAIFDNRTNSARDIIEKIRSAADDDNIRGIILEPEAALCGSVVAEDIGNALQEFRKSGKKVYAYVKEGTDRDYYLCSYADQIVMTPSQSASIMLTGVGSRINFYKRLLDKFGIEFKVVHAGKYKGTGESYVLDAMSPEFRSNLQGVVDSTYVRKLNRLASNRQMDVAQMRAIYESRGNLFISPSEARKMGLVDTLQYRNDFLSELGADEDHLLSWRKYEASAEKSSAAHAVAVVYLQGEIMGGVNDWQQDIITSERCDKLFDQIQNNSAIKAVVLRVNSPGGSALESDIIWHRIQELKKTKKVVVSMGNVAASGGYFISCGADAIIAEPYTITGSIGVVSAIPNLSKAANKWGVSPQKVARGKFTTPFDPLMPFDPNDVASLEQVSQSIYTEFKQRVAESRGLTMDQVEAIAQGKVYSGYGAQEIHLVDGVGTLDDAVQYAAKLASLPNYRVLYYPKTHTMIELLLKNKLDLNSARSAFRNEIVSAFGGLSPEAVTEYFRHEPVQLLAPVEMNED